MCQLNTNLDGQINGPSNLVPNNSTKKRRFNPDDIKALFHSLKLQKTLILSLQKFVDDASLGGRIIVFNHGGRLGKDNNGVLQYLDGKEDSEINDLRNSLLATDCLVFNLYFEHLVGEPCYVNNDLGQAAGQVNDSSSSYSSDEDDESSEDETYNPPSNAYDESSDIDSNKNRMKPRTSTKKKAANGKDDYGNRKGSVDGKTAGNMNMNKKKANSRKYAGKRKKHIRPNFSPNGRGNVGVGSGGNIGGQHTGLSGSKAQPGLLCKHAVAAISRLKNMRYKSEDFVNKSLTMDVVRAIYSYVIQPVNTEKYWIPTDCQGILPPPPSNHKGKKE
ncbi:hypothetical protein Ahy_A01g000590 isoform A [Arachis hypogaea]|uniref:Uncharacterized protein n=1 Tax=Arachis hypogaea TaxID=3818 RepID=A0A445EKM4_ARAHY|nr:hypothetical protein Ahy_A01g000590 isoform A [Arachis hypogaea]